METRTLEIRLHPEAAELYDAACTGDDRDVVLAVEKALVKALYPHRAGRSLSGEYVETDSDLVEVTPA